MHLMHEDLARAHAAQRLEEAVRRERGPPSRRRPPGGTDGPSRPHCAPAVSSPPPSSRVTRTTPRGKPPAPPGARTEGPRPPHRGRGPVMSASADVCHPCDRAGCPDGAEVGEVDGRGRRPPAVAVQPRQGALPGPASPRARSSTTTPGSRRSCCRTSPTGRCPSSGSRTAPTTKGFFAKNAPQGTPDWVRTVRLPAPGQQHGPRDPRLRRRRRPPDAGVGGQPGRPRAARAAVDRRAARRASASPTGWCSTWTRASRPPRSSAPRSRCCCASIARGRRARPSGEDVRLQGDAGLRAGRAGAADRRTSDYAKELAQRLEKSHPRARRLADAQGAAPRQGLRRLEPEQRGQDHRRALRAAGPAGAVGVDAADLGRGRGLPDAGRRPVPRRAGAGAGRRARRPVRAAAGRPRAPAALHPGLWTSPAGRGGSSYSGRSPADRALGREAGCTGRSGRQGGVLRVGRRHL